MSAEPEKVRLDLSLEEAEASHGALEDLLEGDSPPRSAELQRLYRLLGWRILAAKGQSGNVSGLTQRLADLAGEAQSLEEFEEARDDALGPILEGLERGENRDP